jgi:hypothetical protein
VATVIHEKYRLGHRKHVASFYSNPIAVEVKQIAEHDKLLHRVERRL